MSEEKVTIADGDPLPKVIAKINVPEHNEEFEKWQAEMRTKITNNNELMSNINDLANLKHNLWNTRQDLTDKKFELMSTSNKVGRVYKVFRRKVSDSYRFKKEYFEGTKPGLLLKNKEEREIYSEYDLRSIEWFLDTIDLQINWVNDQIATTDKAMYALDNVILLEKEYKNKV